MSKWAFVSESYAEIRDETVNMYPSVQIVIPTYNEENFIQRCLEAISGLEYPRKLISVVVVDSGSIDRTLTLAKASGIICKQVQRVSVAYSRNIGSKDNQSDIIAFLDADCIVSPKWLNQAVSHFSDPYVIAVGSYPAVVEEESSTLQIIWSQLCRGRSSGWKYAEWLPSANFIVRRKAFERVGGFSEQIETCEDVDISYRLRLHGKMVYDPNALVYHLREPKNLFQFFQKEVWHSRSNLHGIFLHGIKLKEIPSLAGPGVFLAGAIIAVVGLLFTSLIPILIGLGLISMPVLTYTVKGLFTVRKPFYLIVLYTIYFVARSYSFGYEIYAMIIRWFLEYWINSKTQRT